MTGYSLTPSVQGRGLRNSEAGAPWSNASLRAEAGSRPELLASGPARCFLRTPHTDASGASVHQLAQMLYSPPADWGCLAGLNALPGMSPRLGGPSVGASLAASPEAGTLQLQATSTGELHLGLLCSLYSCWQVLITWPHRLAPAAQLRFPPACSASVQCPFAKSDQPAAQVCPYIWPTSWDTSGLPQQSVSLTRDSVMCGCGCAGSCCSTRLVAHGCGPHTNQG